MVVLELPEETNCRMSIDDPPGYGTPQPNRNRDDAAGDVLRENSADGSNPRGPIHSSAKQIIESARSAFNTAMKNGAILQEANDWLALTLTKTTIQLHPSSNQLEPADMADMADSLLDIKENRKTAEIVEKVINKANNKHIHVYTIIEKIITKATTKHTPNENAETTTTKNPKASRNNMPSSMWEMYKKQKDNPNKLAVEIPEMIN